MRLARRGRHPSARGSLGGSLASMKRGDHHSIMALGECQRASAPDRKKSCRDRVSTPAAALLRRRVHSGIFPCHSNVPFCCKGCEEARSVPERLCQQQRRVRWHPVPRPRSRDAGLSSIRASLELESVAVHGRPGGWRRDARHRRVRCAGPEERRRHASGTWGAPLRMRPGARSPTANLRSLRACRN